jgi:hypothetical protein
MIGGMGSDISGNKVMSVTKKRKEKKSPKGCQSVKKTASQY